MFEPEIVFEDNQVLVVIKPAGISVQKDISEDTDFLSELKDYIKVRDNKPGNVFLGLVHRLDRPTGGIMVFAKTSKAASRLSKAIVEGKMEKHYLCVVNGKPAMNEDLVVSYLKKDHANNVVRIAPQFEEGAKKAELEYKTLQTLGDYSLVEVNLLTGRSHQIRVQMSQVLKTPLYGDFKYGDKKHGGNLALWAYFLKFNHPVSDKPMTFMACPNLETKPFSAFAIDIKEKIKW